MWHLTSCLELGHRTLETQYKDGLKPSGMGLKKEFNALKKEQFPYVYQVTKYACQQPFIQLQEAWKKYFTYLKTKKGPKVGRPKFKKKGNQKTVSILAVIKSSSKIKP